MEAFVTVFHIVTAMILIALVLLQDTKSSSVGGAFGGGTSNSVLGATGAATLAQQLTRWVAVVFALTSIALSIFAVQANKSVLDSAPPPSAESSKLPPPSSSSSAVPSATAPSAPSATATPVAPSAAPPVPAQPSSDKGK